MKYVINGQITLSKPLEGPLAPHIAPFTAWVSKQGYSRSTLRNRVYLAACFSRWLGEKGISLRGVLSEHPAQYLHERAQQRVIARSDAASLRHFLEFLRFEGVIPPEKHPRPRLNSADKWVLEFKHYLRERCNLSKATVTIYVPFVRDFLNDCFDNRTVQLSRVQPQDLVDFVRRRAQRLCRKRAKTLTTALRSFLRYAQYQGALKFDLSAAVPAVANWSMPSVPRAISAELIRQILASIDRSTAAGRRDYAILLLLARLGLRAGEVTFLELDDINWNTGTLSIRGKSGSPNKYPLPFEVGEAIVAYLKDGRPNSSSRRVFLRVRAPFRGFQSVVGVVSIVRHCIERAGIKTPTKGAHQFRHGLAVEMLHRGASLAEIGDVLGHRSPQTTSIYAKVDLSALRTLALPWPGGE